MGDRRRANSPMEKLANYLRLKGSRDGLYFIEDDKKILEFIMNPDWKGSLRGHRVWERLKEKHFLLLPRIHWNDLKLRAQKLLRPKRELRAWIALTGLKRSRWVDETRPEWPAFNISMRYLRYYLLNKREKGRPETPFDIEEDPEGHDFQDDMVRLSQLSENHSLGSMVTVQIKEEPGFGIAGSGTEGSDEE